MHTPVITETIIEQVQELPEDLQYQVLSFIQSLRAPQKGIPGKNLLPFAGSIAPEDINAIEKAIEEGCEHIDTNEW